MTGTILIGTTSWTDKALIQSGLFYPDDVTTPAGRLHYYATQFPVVEVDSSYYAIPSVRNALLWTERTPPDFTFDVKAFRLFTQHQTDPQALPKDIRDALGPVRKKNVYYKDVPPELKDELWIRFVMALEPLRAAQKLGVVLFQFAPWFVPSRAAFDYILECAERLRGFHPVVEFRNRTWFEGDRAAQVMAFEREHRLAHVVVDEPQGFASSVPALWAVTCPDVPIVRFHGRNTDTWDKKGLSSSGERFNYLYAAAELSELAEKVRGLERKAKSVHAVFNNNFGDYAQRNATQFRQMIHGL